MFEDREDPGYILYVGSWQLIGLDINYLVYKMYQNSSQFSSQGSWSDNNTRGEGQTYPGTGPVSAVSLRTLWRCSLAGLWISREGILNNYFISVYALIGPGDVT